MNHLFGRKCVRTFGRKFQRTLGRKHVWTFLVCGFLVAPPAAMAAPITDTTLVSWDDTSLQVIKDGSSNTILFGEATVVSACLRGVSPIASITDGTSNTIQFGETTDVCWDDREELPFTRGTLPGITDGTSNTILLGETTNYRFDGSSRLEVCASNVSIADGSSNTIQLSEGGNVCFSDMRVAPAAVPEPATVTSLALALLALASRRRGRLLRPLIPRQPRRHA